MRIAAFIWLFIVLIFSVMPVGGPKIGFSLDKTVHFVVYGITAVVFLRDLRRKASLATALILSIAIASVYGFAMEALQLLLPWREFSFMDEMANIGGAVFFGIVYSAKEYLGSR